MRMATRRSDLALVQSKMAARMIMDCVHGLHVVLVEIESEGDRNQGDISKAGGKGLFVSALREAVHAGLADCACHSLKDVGLDTQGFALAAMLPRADPRDALVGKRMSELSGMDEPVVATSSPRRAGQLSCLLPNARVIGIRGNVDTRLRKLKEGCADSLMLACAGLDRLGKGDEASERLDPDKFIPAPGQGIVVVECKADDTDAVSLISAADDSQSRSMAQAERSCAREIGADCDTPLGAHATLTNGGKISLLCSLSMHGQAATGFASGLDAIKVGRSSAQDMLSAGGKEINWRTAENGRLT